MEFEEKRNECNRLMNNLHNCLCLKLEDELSKADRRDFVSTMTYIKAHYEKFIAAGQFKELELNDVDFVIKLRHQLAHQKAVSSTVLNSGIDTLRRCQLALGIKSPVVPMRVMACRRCKEVLTRTAQPTVRFNDISGVGQRVCRAADVQVYMVANNSDYASRINTWYPGWVWSSTFCGGCRRHGNISHIGFRFDWAPEDRVDLSVSKIRYDRERQAMVVETDGAIHDLTHVVADGIIRRHNYVFFEKRLIECDDAGKPKIEETKMVKK